MTKPDKISNTASSYIPHQLKEWQFIPVNRQSKHPLESNWQNRGVPYDSPELAIWLKAGNNYGVLTNENQFVIDADSPEIVKIIESEFPPTFTVLSGSVQTLGMKAHYYFTGHCPKNYKFMNPFYISNPELRKQLNSEYALLNRKYPDLSSVELERHEWLKNELKSWGEVQVKGRHVVGAGSIHPDTGYAYRVIKDIPLAEISEEIILEKFGKFVKKDTSTTKPLHAAFHIPSDLEKIPIDRLIDLTHFKSWGNGQYQGAHPLHGSSTGQNLSVDTIGNRWYCFRCNSGGDPLLWLAQEAGILDCEDCKPGALRGTDFQKVKKIAIERGLLNTESNGKKSKAINFAKRDFTQKEKLAVIDHFWTLPEVQSHPELYRSFEVLLAELEKEEMRRGKFRSGRKQCMTDNTHRIDFKVPWKSNSIFDREERNYYLNEQVEKAEFRIIPFREIYALTKPSLISKRLTRKEEKVIVNTFMKQLKDAINLYVMREKTQEKLGKIEVALLLFTHFWNDQKVHEPDYHLHLLLGSRIRINNEWYALKKEFFTEFLPKKQPQLLIHHVRRNELHLTLRKLYERPYDCISEASMSEDLEQVNYKLENANTVQIVPTSEFAQIVTFYPKHKEIIHFYGLVSNNTYLEIRQELGDIPLDSNPMRDRDLKPIITEILERKKQRKIDLPYQNEYNPNPNENSLKYKTSKELYKKHLKDLYREIRVIRKRKYCRICGSVATIEWTDPFPWYGYHFNYNLSDNENYVLPQEDPPPSIT